MIELGTAFLTAFPSTEQLDAEKANPQEDKDESKPEAPSKEKVEEDTKPVPEVSNLVKVIVADSGSQNSEKGSERWFLRLLIEQKLGLSTTKSLCALAT